MNVRIRLEEAVDRECSLQVERVAFDSEEEPAIVEAVRDEEGSFALVAEADDQVIGHVQFSRAWIGRTPVVALGPVGVVPDRQGRGIGSELIRRGLAEARDRGEVAVILLGSPAFYPRFGFRPGLVFGLDNPFEGVPEEDFMVAPLAGTEQAFEGEVQWPPCFRLEAG